MDDGNFSLPSQSTGGYGSVAFRARALPRTLGKPSILGNPMGRTHGLQTARLRATASCTPWELSGVAHLAPGWGQTWPTWNKISWRSHRSPEATTIKTRWRSATIRLKLWQCMSDPEGWSRHWLPRGCRSFQQGLRWHSHELFPIAECFYPILFSLITSLKSQQPGFGHCSFRARNSTRDTHLSNSLLAAFNLGLPTSPSSELYNCEPQYWSQVKWIVQDWVVVNATKVWRFERWLMGSKGYH